MPIYEYECEACGTRHEALQKINAPFLRDCPACAAPALKRLVSVVGFRLKGSGWYETDFKSDNKRNLAVGDSKEKDASKDTKKSGMKNNGKKTMPEGKGKKNDVRKDAKPAKTPSTKEK